jgi:DNA-binding NtrC family response regulator
VILDLTMPKMDGVAAFGEISRIRPDVRVILSSGYGQQEAIRRFGGQGLSGFIQKP